MKGNNSESRMVLEQELQQNLYLAESKWSSLCSGKKGNYLTERDPQKAALIARLLENQQKWMRILNEDVRTLNTGTFARFVFPMVRAAYANLISTELFSVQPMSGPVSLIFYMDALYGRTKGTAKAGQVAQSALDGHEPAVGYASELVDSETLGTGDGSDTTFPGTLQWAPVRPYSVQITSANGVVVGNDNGAGGVTGTGIAGGGTIDYRTGAISLTTSAALANGVTLNASYRYVMEGNTQRPSMDITLTSQMVQASTWSLETNWSVESEQDFRSVHGIEADATLMAKVAEQLRFEIDRDNIYEVDRVAASSGVTVWDYTPPSASIDFYRHQLTFVNALVGAQNEMFSATRGQAMGNWLVTGTNMATVIEALPQFERVDYSGVKGVVYTGNLAGLKVYKDPWLKKDEGILGHKGSDWTEAGFAFCPYIPLWRTPVITLTDQVRRVGLMSRFARKLINRNYFRKIRVSNFGVLS